MVVIMVKTDLKSVGYIFIAEKDIKSKHTGKK